MTSPVSRYSRDVHYEVLDGIAMVQVGKKRDGTPRMGLGIVCWHFLNEKDARAVARQQGRKVFRVDRQRRTELKVKAAKGDRRRAETVASPPPAHTSGGDERRWWIVTTVTGYMHAFDHEPMAGEVLPGWSVVPVVPASRAETAERKLAEAERLSGDLHASTIQLNNKLADAQVRVRELEAVIRDVGVSIGSADAILDGQDTRVAQLVRFAWESLLPSTPPATVTERNDPR